MDVDVTTTSNISPSTCEKCCPTCGCVIESGSYVKWRYHTDAEFKAAAIKRSAEYIKNRRQRDEAYDAKLKEQWREHARKNAEKMSQDPEKLAKRKEYMRQYHQRRRADRKVEVNTPVSLVN